jgi:outer membrane usher protein
MRHAGALLLALGGLNAVAASAPGAAVPAELLLTVRVNGQALRDVAGAERLADGRLALAAATWREMRLTPPGETVRLSDGAPAHALEAVPGLRYAFDPKKLLLDVTAPPSQFAAQAVGAPAPAGAAATRPGLGAILNYDAVASVGGTHRGGGAMLEGRVFGPHGSLTASGVVRTHAQGGAPHAQRLDTAWQTDLPERMETLVVGDTASAGGGWSRPVRYGGVRFGRDFSLRPGYVTAPQASVGGSAALPSTVDVLVNGQQRMTREVQPGNFEVSHVPLVGGAGEVNLVVRDLLGRETVVTQSYYAAPQLLAPGLTDYQVEAGFLREGYGSDQDQYGKAFAAASLRQGLTPEVTAEVRGEVLRLRQAAGIEMTSLLANYATVRATLAHSRTPERSGTRWGLAAERSTQRGGWSAAWDGFARGFTQLGAVEGELAPRSRLQLGAFAPLGDRASLGLSYTRQEHWDAPTVAVLGASVNVALQERTSLSLSFSRQSGAREGWRAGLSLAVPLDNGWALNTGVDRTGEGRLSGTVQAASATPSGLGRGWYLRASDNDGAAYAGGLALHTSVAELAAEVEAGRRTDAAVRLAARGSVGTLGGLRFAAPPLGQEGFAVVQAGGLEGVPVMRAHQVVATTNAQGLALVPGLLPYQANTISIDTGELPMDVQVAASQIEVVPYARSGVVVDFVARRERSVLAQLVMDDGREVPAGARVEVGSGEPFVVARRGEVYLVGIGDSARLDVRWSGGHCRAFIDVPAGEAGQRVGPVACQAQVRS